MTCFKQARMRRIESLKSILSVYLMGGWVVHAATCCVWCFLVDQLRKISVKLLDLGGNWLTPEFQKR